MRGQGRMANLTNKLVSKTFVGVANAIGAMAVVIAGYFAFVSDSEHKYTLAFLSCVGLVPAYLVYRLAMRFYDGV